MINFRYLSLIIAWLLITYHYAFAAEKAIWQGTSGGLKIMWTPSDITASENNNLLFSARELAKQAFEADFLAMKASAFGTCDSHYDLALLSLVGSLASLEEVQHFTCREKATPATETRYRTIDMKKANADQSLTDFFQEADILNALLADPAIKVALAQKNSPITTLAKFTQALEWAEIKVKKCDYYLPHDFLQQFAFHHLVDKKALVAVRINLLPVIPQCQQEQVQLAFYLPIPTTLKTALNQTKSGNGFLMGKRQPALTQQRTSFKFSTQPTEDISVQDGDTLTNLAKRYDLDVEKLFQINELPNANYLLKVGQKLKIPTFTWKWARTSQIHPTLPEFEFKLLGDTLTESSVKLAALQVRQINQVHPFQTIKLNLDNFFLGENAQVNGFYVEDVNFDNYQDMRIRESSNVIDNIPYLYWLFEPRQGQFAYNKAFAALVSLEVDAEKKLLKSVWRDGTMRFGIDYYQVIDNKPLLVKQEEKIYTDKGLKKLIVRERVGNEMKVVAETVPENDKSNGERAVRKREKAVTQRIITAFGVNMRAAAKPQASVVEQLTLGTVVNELARGQTSEVIEQKRDYWYQVETSTGKRGWIFGSYLLPFDSEQRANSYLQLAQQRLKNSLAINDQMELTDFLARIQSEVQNSVEVAAELALLHLQALQKALEYFDWEKSSKPPYQNWLTKLNQQHLIFFDEIQGRWLINQNVFWDLHDKYYPLPIADQIGWAAAEYPVGGECEGFLACNLQRLNQTVLKYLKHHPTGSAVEAACNKLVEFLAFHTQEKNLMVGKEDVEVPTLLAILQATVARTNATKKAEIISQLAKLKLAIENSLKQAAGQELNA
jgi:LysM repeat protein